ncbi:hypothetical protein ES319_A05G390100v1 [Gossypium barbadense]|uniref:Uncharacterized protein n=2 Tax=Gossypium TaxID=3633 RepID=A0A5J5W1N5_GOSBA|nr:hypothetical protein ES319_A05G390100v1 [Gossypium barbadense]TYH20239.1 hypothetical protein ES288_A05G415500v1 [Gossypium darwinii]
MYFRALYFFKETKKENRLCHGSSAVTSSFDPQYQTLRLKVAWWTWALTYRAQHGGARDVQARAATCLGFSSFLLKKSLGL